MIKLENFSLSTILYYRIGGTARFLLEARNKDEVFEALDFVRANQIPRLLVLGLGSNLIFPDGLFDGAVLRIVGGAERQVHDLGGGFLEAFAGEDLDQVINSGFDRGYAGLEWAGGLPGTVGAAVRGNVGAFGGEAKDVLESAEVLERGDGRLEVKRFSNSDLAFSYRDSTVKRDRRLVVLSATFRLQTAEGPDLETARQVYRSNIEYRHRNHPMEYPTCGSVFKNLDRPEEVERVLAVWPDLRELVEGRWHGKVSMGYAVKRFGLSGYQVGDAQISPKHCNFIVNLGNASSSDVCRIIDEVKQKFSEAFGFVPEAEVEIVGSGG